MKTLTLRKIVFLYIGIAFVFSISMGASTWETIMLLTNGRSESFQLTDYVGAELEGSTLHFCIKGRYPGEQEAEYEVSIPLRELSEIYDAGAKLDAHLMPLYSEFLVSREDFFQGCSDRSFDSEITSIHINIRSLSLTLDEVINQVGYGVSHTVFYEVVNEYSGELSIVIFLHDKYFKDFFIMGFVSYKYDPVLQDYLYLPIAVIKDAVTFPYQIYLWSQYVGSH